MEQIYRNPELLNICWEICADRSSENVEFITGVVAKRGEKNDIVIYYAYNNGTFTNLHGNRFIDPLNSPAKTGAGSYEYILGLIESINREEKLNEILSESNILP